MLCKKNETVYKSLPGQKTKYLKELEVLAQSLQLTPTNLELFIRIKGERKLESARNEISGFISCPGSSFGVHTSN